MVCFESGWVPRLGILLIVAIAIPLSAIAQPQAVPSQERVAQTTADLCRQVSEPEGLTVRLRPTPNSPPVGELRHQDQVTLAPNYRGIRGPGGRTWVEITSPMRGFVSNGFPDGRSNLVLCSQGVMPQPSPQQPASLCRRIDRVAAPGGVAVRERPSRLSDRVGGVPAGQEVYLVDGYQLLRDPNNEPRNWVQITKPLSGFISANTLIMCR